MNTIGVSMRSAAAGNMLGVAQVPLSLPSRQRLLLVSIILPVARYD